MLDQLQIIYRLAGLCALPYLLKTYLRVLYTRMHVFVCVVSVRIVFYVFIFVSIVFVGIVPHVKQPYIELYFSMDILATKPT